MPRRFVDLSIYLENDVISVRSDLNLNVFVTTAFLTYGVLDKLDVGVAVPIVRTSLSGTSQGTVSPFGANSPHFFGTPTSPSLTASGSTCSPAADDSTRPISRRKLFDPRSSTAQTGPVVSFM